MRKLLLFIAGLSALLSVQSQEESVARQWNEVLLESIRDDFARPTVHARNLFHTSTVMYDAWAVYDDESVPFFLGNNLGGLSIPFEGVPVVDDVQAAQEEAISYAAYRLLKTRFDESPSSFDIYARHDELMEDLGYDISFTSTDYQNGPPAALGNYIAEKMIEFGMIDGSNQQFDYMNNYYEPVNFDLDMEESGNPDLTDPNRWQPLGLTEFVDQSGNPITETPPFLSPEWGNVVPFSFTGDDVTTNTRNGDQYNVWIDPGAPPYIDPNLETGLEDAWKWGFALVVTWSSHLAPDDGVIWDISPASIGNLPELPETIEDYPNMYDLLNGGDNSMGRDINPYTGQSYEAQYVPRGDYGRVLAEFWADGPDSETPPGHWFAILNYVSDNPLFEKRWMGEGEILSDLEWDIKSYFTLGGTMHDSAIAAWSVKGWYDYIRPVSAIRYMAEKGQSSDPGLPNYDPAGFPLIPDYIEQIEIGDPLAGDLNENVGEIKVLAWKGPNYIEVPATDEAGVDWIMAKDWWPYQRPSFVTPPFAGYVSGHSTFSRAAAEVMTVMTGDEYFPGGMGVFDTERNQFLVFEEGPSLDIELQWATYRDASDQCSLSRIWGGIHPPADDIPGRKMGIQVGNQAFDQAMNYISPDLPRIELLVPSTDVISDNDADQNFTLTAVFSEDMNTNIDPGLSFIGNNPVPSSLNIIGLGWLSPSTFVWTFTASDANEELHNITVQINGAESALGEQAILFTDNTIFTVDTQNPIVDLYNFNEDVSDQIEGTGTFSVALNFSEAMDTNLLPDISFPTEIADITLTQNFELSSWMSDSIYQVVYDVVDNQQTLEGVDLTTANAKDLAGNDIQITIDADQFNIDMLNPVVVAITPNTPSITDDNIGLQELVFTIDFSEEMNTDMDPILSLPAELASSVLLSEGSSAWTTTTSYTMVYDIVDEDLNFGSINAMLTNFQDQIGNMGTEMPSVDLFLLDTKAPEVISITSNEPIIADAQAGSATLFVSFMFDEMMDTSADPSVALVAGEDLGNSFTLNNGLSAWSSDFTYSAVYDVSDENLEVDDISFEIDSLNDLAGNTASSIQSENLLTLDTKNPQVLLISANEYLLQNGDVGPEGFEIIAIYDEAMDPFEPLVSFPDENPLTNSLDPNPSNSGWLNDVTYSAVFDVNSATETLEDIDVQFGIAKDEAGNTQVNALYSDYFSIMIDSTVTVSEMMLDENTLFLFPNPVQPNDWINLNNSSLDGIVLYSIYDLNGKLVAQNQDQLTSGTTLAIPTTSLESGMYIMTLFHADKQTVLRFTVQ